MVQLFIVKDVPEETIFKAKRTGEIAGHEWFLFKHLLAIKKDPSKTAYNEKSFTGVFPFLQQIKNWLDEEAMQK
jgi:hypothetical protein